MALTHLVDTSVLTRLGRPEVRAVVAPLVEGGRAARPSISDLEVGHSARNAREWDALAAGLDAFALVEVVALHVRRAHQVQRLLADRGLRGRKVPDLLVAAAGELWELEVLHYDTDFDHIASVTGQRCRWAVPGGSVS